MDKEKIAKVLMQQIPASIIRLDEPMKNHTTFKIGGPADIFVAPEEVDDLLYILKVCRDNNIPYYIIGNGSNLLVDDGGYRGIIIQIFRNMSNILIEDNEVYVQAGALLAKVANECLGAGLTGFEFAHGIPGTMGGAVYMNAGAYGGEIKQVLVSADVIDQKGNRITLTNEELELGYRTSKAQKEQMLVIGARMSLQQGDPGEIKEQMEHLAYLRRSKQPLTLPSAGSTFKRPEGCFAGKLIMDAGLRGFRIGDAAVSEKHCGFVVNLGEATAKDVKTLMKHIQQTIKERFDKELIPEVRVIGEE